METGLPMGKLPRPSALFRLIHPVPSRQQEDSSSLCYLPAQQQTAHWPPWWKRSGSPAPATPADRVRTARLSRLRPDLGITTSAPARAGPRAIGVSHARSNKWSDGHSPKSPALSVAAPGSSGQPDLVGSGANRRSAPPIASHDSSSDSNRSWADLLLSRQ